MRSVVDADLLQRLDRGDVAAVLERAPKRDRPQKLAVVVVRVQVALVPRVRNEDRGVGDAAGDSRLSIAAEYRIGLNAEPTWRIAWVARLNLLFSKS